MNTQKNTIKNTKQLFAVVLLISITSFSVKAQKTYSIDDVPNVHLQDARQYVSDPERKIPQRYVEAINEELAFFEDSLAIQCATIVLPKIDEEPSTFTHDLLNKWGVGNKETDKGLVILLVYGDGEGSKREIYMATGYGLEGDLPDAICKEIQVDVMVPLLKEEKFGEGLVAGIDGIHKALTDEETKIRVAQIVEQEKKQATEDEIIVVRTISVWGIIGTIIMSIFIFIKRKRLLNIENPYQTLANFQNKDGQSQLGELGCWLALIFLPWVLILEVFTYYIKRRFIKKHLRCDVCGSSSIKFKSSSKKVIVRATPSEEGITRYTFVCKNCNHRHFEDCKTKYIFSSSSGGGNSSSSSSGGSSGGSWGGGSSGGGGSGTSF